MVPHLEELFLEDCSPGVKSCAEQTVQFLGGGTSWYSFSYLECCWVQLAGLLLLFLNLQ